MLVYPSSSVLIKVNDVYLTSCVNPKIHDKNSNKKEHNKEQGNTKTHQGSICHICQVLPSGVYQIINNYLAGRENPGGPMKYPTV